MSVISTRTIFMSSEQNSSGDSRILNYNLSSQLINYPPNHRLRLILNTFACPKTWYSINQFNGIFYIGNLNPELFECQIPAGNYKSLDDIKPVLEQVIQDTLVANFAYLGTTTVDYDDTTGHFTITLSVAVPNIMFVCFSVQGSFNAYPGSPLEAALSNVSNAGKYNDVDQVLGGSTNRSVQGLSDVSQLTQIFTIVPPTTTAFRSKYPANLQTNDALYLRISSLSTNNLESTNLSLNYTLNQIITSDIFAKILLPTDLTTKFIDYIDPNSNFVMEIGSAQLTNLRIALTDSKARLIPLVSPTQATDGSINYSLSIKIEEIN